MLVSKIFLCQKFVKKVTDVKMRQKVYLSSTQFIIISFCDTYSNYLHYI